MIFDFTMVESRFYLVFGDEARKTFGADELFVLEREAVFVLIGEVPGKLGQRYLCRFFKTRVEYVKKFLFEVREVGQRLIVG